MIVNDLVLGTDVGDPNHHLTKHADVMVVMMIHASRFSTIPRLDFLCRLIHVIVLLMSFPAHQPMPTHTTFANPPPPSSCTHRATSGSRATGQPLWLTAPTEWTSGDGLLDRNHLYSFTLCGSLWSKEGKPRVVLVVGNLVLPSASQQSKDQRCASMAPRCAVFSLR